MTQLAEKETPWMTALEERPTTGPRWLQDIRDQGAERFARLGFPTVRNEEWRFTSVSQIAGAELSLAPASLPLDEARLETLPLRRRAAPAGVPERPLRAGAVADIGSARRGALRVAGRARRHRRRERRRAAAGQPGRPRHARVRGLEHGLRRRRRLRLGARRRRPRDAAAAPLRRRPTPTAGRPPARPWPTRAP